MSLRFSVNVKRIDGSLTQLVLADERDAEG